MLLNKNWYKKQGKKFTLLIVLLFLSTSFIMSTMPKVKGGSTDYNSDNKDYWMDEFHDFSKIKNSSNIVVSNGEAKIIGPGLNFFINAYDITPSKKGSWQTVDVSELIPKGSTGVILQLMNIHKRRQLNIAVKTLGSSDPYQYSAIRQKGHIYALCGVDENQKFEAYIQRKECRIILAGYTDSAVYFFKNRVDKSLSISGSWVDIDLSSDIPEDATGVIFQIINTKKNKLIGNNNRKASIRQDGSSDNTDNTDICEGGGKIYAICGVNDREIEGYIESGENGNLKHYLVGYTRYPIHFFRKHVNIVSDNVDSWKDINIAGMTTIGTNGVIFEIRNKAKNEFFSDHQCAVRTVYSHDERKETSYILFDGHIWGLAGTDRQQKFEINNGHKDIYFRLLGYSEGVYSGYLYSTMIEPSSLTSWCSFSWNDVESRNTDIKYQLEYYNGRTWSLIPDRDLPKNSVGFDDSPVELSNLKINVYNKIRLKANLSTKDTSFTPKIKNWGVTWQTKENKWEDNFLTNYRVKSSENIYVENDVTLGINHSNWYTYGQNSQRVGVPEMDLGPTTNHVLWKANVSGTLDAFAGAIVVDGVVYACGKYFMTRDKKENWIHHPGHTYTFALDAETGEKIWMFPTGSVDDAPTYHNGMIFVGEAVTAYQNRVERLWCLDAIDGSPIWVFNADDCAAEDLGKARGTPVIAEDKNLVIALSNNYLYGVNLTTGKKMWSTRLPNAKKTPTTPTYFNGVVYVGCEIKDMYGDWLYAYEVYEDQVKLKWAAGGTDKLIGNSGIHDSSPTIYKYNGEYRLYIGCMDGNIHELDLNNGKIIRTYDTAGIRIKDRSILGTPAIHNDVLFAGSMNGHMYAIKLSDFSLKWKRQCGGNTFKDKIINLLDRRSWQRHAIFSTAAIANGIVYYGSQDDKVYAVSEENGELCWSYETGNGLYGQAAISDGIMYIASDDWYLYAFGPPSGPTYRHYPSGNITSTTIKKSNSMKWDKFHAGDTTPVGTSITYKILDENNNVIRTVKDGDDLSSISQNTIMLTACLETANTQKTPILHYWEITTTPTEAFPIEIIIIVIICIVTILLAVYGMIKFSRHKKK